MDGIDTLTHIEQTIEVLGHPLRLLATPESSGTFSEIDDVAYRYIE